MQYVFFPLCFSEAGGREAVQHKQSEALLNPLISKKVVMKLGNNPHKFLTLSS